MPENTLKEIEKMEEKAQQKLEEAKREKNEIIQGAHRGVDKIIATAEEEAKKEGEKLKEEQIKLAEEESKKIKEEFKKEQNKIEEIVEKEGMSLAIKFILEKARKAWRG